MCKSYGMPTQPLLTVQDIADEMRVTKRTVYGLIASGEIVAMNVSQGSTPQGARLRIRRADFDRFLESRRVAA